MIEYRRVHEERVRSGTGPGMAGGYVRHRAMRRSSMALVVS